MTAARAIPDYVREAQIAAANPAVSVFVSANAGSGKTYVLAQRVINLLLEGVDPARILCITFTKAAAANMANEVFKRLAEWTSLADGRLDAEIERSTGKKPDAAMRARARRLFASALETPGGLKVQTIHAFCTRLLHQFPFEADVAARFTVLDEAATAQLLDQLTLQVLLNAAARPDGALGKALAGAIVAAADQTFKDVVADAIKQRDKFTAWKARAGGIENAVAELSTALGVAPEDSIEAVEQEYFSASLLPETDWPALIDIFRSGSKTDNDQADGLAVLRALSGRERVEAYIDVFCRRDDRASRARLMTMQIAEKHPKWLARLHVEQERVCKLIVRERALRCRDRTAALIIVAMAVIERYRAEKDRRGLLDYDDQIDKTLALFTNTSAAWVLYKLDLGIDHVLIDEAQDTSPKQWEIIKTLVSEFVPGGARENVRRTMFAVGDEKQSIFSFQGADPGGFARTRQHFARLFAQTEFEFREHKLQYSFRAGADVLGAVDTVFKREEAYLGLAADPAPTAHQALPDATPGLAEIWDLIEPEEKAEIEGWDAPFDRTSETSPAVKLSRKIANRVRAAIARGDKAGDVLILVRQRGPLFASIIRALKDAGVPVAGADRLVLTEHIAVMDLLVLGDALLLPDDDLALATVLKSPLFGFDEEQLFALAWDRKGSLRAALRAKAKDDPMFEAAMRALDEMSEQARQMTPFAFYAHVLGARRGRRNFLARLGIEAADPLDEFLNLALDYEQRETPSLQGFLNWLRAAQSEIKRDMEMARDEVRVMTVHGAKGLEAKTVILADTTGKPTGVRDPRLLPLPLAGAAPGASALAWATAKGNDVDAMAQARTDAQRAAQDEYRRLLYVAMTRAAERLIVCGVKGKNEIPDGCWYRLVRDALEPLAVMEDGDDGKVLRFYKTKPKASTSPPPKMKKEKLVLPPWLNAMVTPEREGPRLITPSDSGADAPRHFAGDGERAQALLRGSLTHRLMQSLPDIPPERRAAAAQKYLARAGATLPQAERDELASQVLHLLGDSRLQALFAPGSRAEVPIVGKLDIGGKSYRVSGQIDRLAVTDDAILIADYKSNRPAPRKLEDVPNSYLRQLALYRGVLRLLYPTRSVKATLIWTEVPDLMELSDSALDAALEQVTSA